LSKGGVVNSLLHFSAKGRTTATVYRKGGAFFDSYILFTRFLLVVQNNTISARARLKRSHGRHGNRFHLRFAVFPATLTQQRL
jgi:hypothetical protein